MKTYTAKFNDAQKEFICLLNKVIDAVSECSAFIVDDKNEYNGVYKSEWANLIGNAWDNIFRVQNELTQRNSEEIIQP